MDAAANFKRFEAEGWSTRTDSYELLTGAITARAAEAQLDAVSAGPGVHLLDVGCGTGALVSSAVGRGATAVGLDLSDGMLEAARARNPDVEFRLGDAEELPFGDAEFAALTAAFVINHLPAPERAVAEARRVLEPGGRAAFAIWDRPERTRVLGLLRDAIEEAGVDGAAVLPTGGPDPFRYADDGAFRALLVRLGSGVPPTRSSPTTKLALADSSSPRRWISCASAPSRRWDFASHRARSVRDPIRAKLPPRSWDGGSPASVQPSEGSVRASSAIGRSSASCRFPTRRSDSSPGGS
jgi:SAM-dependent methyltransferase